MAKLTSNKTGGGNTTTTHDGAFNTPPPTVWSSLTPTELVTPDVYGGKNSGTHGTATGSHKLNAGGLLQAIMSGDLKSILPKFKDFQGKIKKGIEFARNVEKALKSGGSTTDRIANVLGVTASGISSITGKDGLLGSLIGGDRIENSVLGKITGNANLLLKIGEDIRAVGNTDFSDMSQIANLLNKIGSNGSYIATLSDPLIKGLFGADIVNRLGEMGIGGMVTQIGEILEDDSMHAFLNAILPGVIKRGDLKGIAEILKFLGKGKFRSLAPNFYRDLSGNFTLDGINAGRMPQHVFEEVGSIFASANEEWYKTRTNGNYTIGGDNTFTGTASSHLDLTKLNNGTSDFNKVINAGIKTTEDPNMKLMGLAPLFQGLDVTKQIKKDYPYLLLRDQTIRL